MSRNRVYVGKLSSRVTERDLKDMFGKYGRIDRLELKYNYAFVEYEDNRDADDAIRDLDGRELEGSRILVEQAKGPGHSRYAGRERYERERERDRYSRRGPARSDYRVLVDNLSYSTSWQGLKDYIRKEGDCDVIYADIYKDSRNSSKGSGVVEFRTYDDMKRALRKLNDTELDGNYIKLSEDERRERRRSRGRYSPYSRRSRSGSRRRSYSRSPSPRRSRRSPSPRKSRSPSPRDNKRSPSPRRSVSPRDDKKSPSPRKSSRSPSPRRDSKSPSPKRDGSPRRSPSPRENGRSRSQSPQQ